MNMFAQQTDTSLGLQSAAQALDQKVERGFGPDRTLEHEIIDLKSVINKEAEQMAESQISYLMKELDTNGDGVVSLTELRDASTEKNLNKLVQKGLISESQAVAMKEHAWTYQRHGAVGVSSPGEEASLDPTKMADPSTELHDAKVTPEQSIEKILEAMRSRVQPEIKQEITQQVEPKTAEPLKQEKTLEKPELVTQKILKEELVVAPSQMQRQSPLSEDPFQKIVSQYLGADLNRSTENKIATSVETIRRNPTAAHLTQETPLEQNLQPKKEESLPKQSAREELMAKRETQPSTEPDTAAALAEERRMLMKRLGMVTEEQLSKNQAA